jgi:hypothetical protein
LTIKLRTDADSLHLPAASPGDRSLETDHWKLATACDSSLHTAFVCDQKKLPFAGYSVVKELLEASGCGPFGSQPAERHVRGQLLSKPVGSLHLPAASQPRPCHSPELSIVTSPGGDCKLNRDDSAGHRSERQGPRPRPPNEVENTGLEPVTSWLQTRRSPS